MNTLQTPSRIVFRAQTRFLTLASVINDTRGLAGRLRTVVLRPITVVDEPAPDIELRSEGSPVAGQARRQHHQSRAAQQQQFARAIRGEE